jgi:hypothetical protein
MDQFPVYRIMRSNIQAIEGYSQNYIFTLVGTKI